MEMTTALNTDFYEETSGFEWAFNNSVFNYSAYNDSAFANDTGIEPASKHIDATEQLLITTLYMIGIIGNISALVILAQNETLRNKRQTLMLRCLACNDLIALVGSFILMYGTLYTPVEVGRSRCVCGVRVFWRTFGLGSGCVAVVMAVERCLALTRPFEYQKHITYKWIKWSIFGLWAIIATIVCLPFVGFGLYYDDTVINETPCTRYRLATSIKDIIYAILVVVVGLLMCICIVGCNLCVMGVLCQIRKNRGLELVHNDTTRRIKGNRELRYNHATQEEVAFAKLMAIICIFFVVCWLPQMCTVILALLNPVKKDKGVYRIADVCIALNFSLDPFIYVIFRRHHHRRFFRMMKPFCHSCQTETPSRAESVSRESTSTTFTGTGNFKMLKTTPRGQTLSNGDSFSSSSSSWPQTPLKN